MDARHIDFVSPRGGDKVREEFTVPLCLTHLGAAKGLPDSTEHA